VEHLDTKWLTVSRTGDLSRTLKAFPVEGPPIPLQIFQRRTRILKYETIYCTLPIVGYLYLLIKGVGSSCGGDDGVNGKCAVNLYCNKINPSSSGTCATKSSLPQCIGTTCTQNCPSVSNCPNGIGTDQCGCCSVCAGGDGATCDLNRPCGNGYYCSGDSAANNNQAGTCRRWNKNYCYS
ncbi:hypothetical protein Anas_10775, partial [Armadillidium nasatum]